MEILGIRLDIRLQFWEISPFILDIFEFVVNSQASAGVTVIYMDQWLHSCLLQTWLSGHLNRYQMTDLASVCLCLPVWLHSYCWLLKPVFQVSVYRGRGFKTWHLSLINNVSVLCLHITQIRCCLKTFLPPQFFFYLFCKCLIRRVRNI